MRFLSLSLYNLALMNLNLHGDFLKLVVLNEINFLSSSLFVKDLHVVC